MTHIFYIEGDIFSFGRSDFCDFSFPENDLLSQKHLVIERSSEISEATMTGKNGGYHQDLFIERGHSLKITYGSEIRLPQITILYLNPFIVIESDTSLKTKNRPASFEMIMESVLSKEERKSFMASPVSGIFIDKTPIELEAPPRKGKEERKKLINSIAPSLMMSVPMILGLGFTMFFRRDQNRSFMYMGVITAVSSGLIGAIMAFSNLREREKQIRIEEKNRKITYERYVQNCEEKIRERFHNNKNALKAMNPEIRETLCYPGDLRSIYSYSGDDSEAFNIRLGTGIKAFETQILVPKERYESQIDELNDLPVLLKNKYMHMKDVPICINLLEKNPVGLICENEAGFVEILRLIILSIVSRIGPSDLSVCVAILNSEKILAGIGFIRFLPHLIENKYICIAKNPSFAKEIINDRREGVKKLLITDSYCQFEECIKEDLICLILANDFYSLPPTCHSIIQKDSKYCGYIEFTKGRTLRDEISFDMISDYEFRAGITLLAGLSEDIEKREKNIPDKVEYLEVLKGITLNEKGVMELWNNSRVMESISVPIGVCEDGVILNLDLHERFMGPHGLIAGTTGSGKSEILQTIILGLSLKYSPWEVGFFLIDYKGGTMSALFEKLPHILGMVSNLSGSNVNRAMLSIKSENERRQLRLTEAKVNNISDYIALYRQGKVKEAMPHVFIIVDEFAELRKEDPDFMKELISVARVGRSLGVHLILATQKPAGTVDENILSNTRFRICLRVMDKQDSNEILHTYDAAGISNPGRAILQVGNNEVYKFFQGAYTMAAYKPAERKQCIYKLNELGGAICEKNDKAEKCETSLNAILGLISRTYSLVDKKLPEKLWKEPLGREILFPEGEFNAESLGRKNPQGMQGIRQGDLQEIILSENTRKYRIPLGIYDNPRKQEMGEYIYDIFSDGHLLVLGGIISGKTNLLELISMFFIKKHTPGEINLYYIETGSFKLARFKNSGLCGGYFNEDNENDIEKLFIFLERESEKRKRELNGQRYGPSVSRNIAPIILFIDGIGAFREKSEGRYDQYIGSLIKSGEMTGIYFVISSLGISNNELPGKFFEHIRTVIPLTLNEKYKYQEALRVSSEKIIAHEDVPGRGLIKKEGQVLEFQSYLYYSAFDEKNEDFEVALMMERNTSYGMSRAKAVPCIPANPDINDLLRSIEERKISVMEDQLPLGYEEKSGLVYIMQLKKRMNVIISGRKGSGKSNFIRLISQMAEKYAFNVSTDDSFSYENITISKIGNKWNFFVCDEAMSMKDTVSLKEAAGENPLVIHFGGQLDRQSMADFSYIPYTKQSVNKAPGRASVCRSIEGIFYGDVVIPRCL